MNTNEKELKPVKEKREPVSACLSPGCKLPGNHEQIVLGDYSHRPAPVSNTNRKIRRQALKAKGFFGQRRGGMYA